MYWIFILWPQKRKKKEKKKKKKKRNRNCLSFDMFCFSFWLCCSHQHFKRGCGFPALSFTFHIHCSVCFINPIPVYTKISWDVDGLCSGSGSADHVGTTHGRISLSGDCKLWLLVWICENIVFLNDKSRFRADVEEGGMMRELGAQHFYV